MTATILKNQFRKCINCKNCFRPCFESHIIYDYEPEEESGCERCELYNYGKNEHTFTFIPTDEVIATLIKAERTDKVYDDVDSINNNDQLLYDIIVGTYFASKHFEFEDGYVDAVGDAIDGYIDFELMSKIIQVYDNAVRHGEKILTKQDFAHVFEKLYKQPIKIRLLDYYDD